MADNTKVRIGAVFTIIVAFNIKVSWTDFTKKIKWKPRIEPSNMTFAISTFSSAKRELYDNMNKIKPPIINLHVAIASASILIKRTNIEAVPKVVKPIILTKIYQLFGLLPLI